MKIAVAGSIATDQLMTFDGYFGELFREALPHVFVSFLADELVIRHSPGDLSLVRAGQLGSLVAGLRLERIGAREYQVGEPQIPDCAAGWGGLRDVQVRRCWAPRASSWAVVVDQPDLIVVMASDGRGSVWPQPRLPPGWPDGARPNRAGADDAAVPVVTDAGLSVLPRSSIGRRHRPGT